MPNKANSGKGRARLMADYVLPALSGKLFDSSHTKLFSQPLQHLNLRDQPVQLFCCYLVMF